MALRQRGAHEEESIHGRADGCSAAGGRPYVGGRDGQEAQGQRADDLRLAQALRRALAAGHKAASGLEGENARLKKLLAERELAIDVLKEINHRKW